jgi:DNA mismatch repair protein MutL
VEIARIFPLEEQLANQIAAGEVVERPGSALKELVENSLDAGATSVIVKISEGGVRLLEVSDNGHGIHPEDFPLALGRHATSKIRQTSDLFAIKSWGFRGEALASIGAVSRLTLSSRTFDQKLGREVLTEGGEVKRSSEIARAQGTTVRVEELFFNTPARRKFLKSQGAETAHCWQTLHRLALGSPNVSFEAWQDLERVFHYPAVKDFASRVVQVYQETWKLNLDEKELLELRADSSPLKMRGFVLPARHFIPSSRGIFTFVNGRSVKDKLLQQAILAAAKEVLFGRLYPQLVLMLEAPPDWVDVNVHPAKSEVRFREPGHVFGFVRKYLEKLLSEDRSGSVSMTVPGFTPAATLADLLLPMPETSVQYHQKGAGAPYQESSHSVNPGYSPGAAHPQGPQFLGTLRNTYLVCQDENGLLLVDQHAAHERVTYEQLKKSSFDSAGSSPLLISLQVDLPRATLDRIENGLPLLAELGLVLERTGPTLLAVRELPNLLLKRDGSPVLPPGELVRKIAGEWEEEADAEGLAERLRELMLETLASQSCHGSVRAGQTLSPPEAQALLAQMSETDFSGHCPHGRPTTLKFSWTEIERLFKRLV